MGFLSELVDKLARRPEDIRAENLRHWINTLPDITPLSEASARQRHKVAGVIQNIRIDPRTGRDSLEATITDGSGTLIAKWLGRPKMSGIRLGAGLIVEGVVGTQDGDLVLLNPEYELVPGPEHG
ncbi:MAG: OB-fold nucleic acid binding domain-containing protein [Actinobacteria bacterium]|nr:OB-fold nucleic acid binding domain-containing protein [Actinomycetota bacterium]